MKIFVTAFFGLIATCSIGCVVGDVGEDDASTGSLTDDATNDAADAVAGPCSFAHSTVVDVTTARELDAALADASPGTLIRLAKGTYRGTFVASRSGSPGRPIVLCGARDAVLDGGSTSSGYVIHLTGSDWVMSGFTVQNGQKGIVLDHAQRNLLRSLRVREIGDEGVHFRSDSSENKLERSTITDTGKEQPGFGEGVYIGSAKSNWGRYSSSGTTPDRSDNNKILNNTIGPNVAAEGIDVKEGTTGGVIRGNTFIGDGQTGENYGDSWVDVKGNGYLIERNTGRNPLRNGFEVHQQLSGWGNDNVFRGNVASVPSGVAFSIDKKTSGNRVTCDNQVTGGPLGTTCQ